MGTYTILISTRRLTTIAMLSCLSFVGRMAFSFLPNMQPTTVIIIIITMYFGLTDGLLVATLSMLMSNVYLGMGVWTIAQIASYSVIVIAVGLLVKLNLPYRYFGAVSFTSGLLYGLIISLVQAPFFGWVSFIPYYISGIPYDFSHAVGNLLFFIVLHPVLRGLLLKQNKRYKRV